MERKHVLQGVIFFFLCCGDEGTGHLKSVCLAHNALGSTGFELVLKTLPISLLTHLDLSAVCRGPTDYPALEHLTKVLTQVFVCVHSLPKKHLFLNIQVH